jgi:cellulose synthase (UDP-forming)
LLDSSEQNSGSQQTPKDSQPLTPRERILGERAAETPAEARAGEAPVESRVVETRAAEPVTAAEQRAEERREAAAPVAAAPVAAAPVAAVPVEEAARERALLGEREERAEVVRRPVTATQKRVLGFTWIGIFSMLFYGVFMILALFNPGYDLKDRIASILLLLGVLFILMHGLGYANSMIKSSWGYNEVRRRAFTPQRAPKVACVIASYNEPPDVLEETVAALMNIDYPNKEIAILDDSTNEESRRAAQEIAAKYGTEIFQRTNRRGYKAGAVNDFIKRTDAAYVAVFDADALPAHNFLRDVVPIIEENPRLAFVQTPQYYANTGISNVAMAASRQQAVFYEYICEGKSHSRAAFCCGTNVIFRRSALLDVGGFDENSVTEDFSTSLNLHLKGYDSNYYNQVYVYSLAPETLGAYFTQQARWAFGSVGSMRRVFGSIFRHPGSMRLGQWWEYFLSSSYYWVGWVNFIFMLLPLAFIFFGIQPLRQDVFTYLAILIPYFVFTMNMFYAGMEQRGYRMSEMLLGQQVAFITFPVHMMSALSGIIGMKRPFGVTPKGDGRRLSWLSLWPQIIMLILSAIAFLYGMFLYITGAERTNSAIVINALWALYHVFLLSGIFALNRVPLRRSEAKPYFDDRLQAAGATPAMAGVPATGATTAPVFAPAPTSRRVDRADLAPPVRATRPGLSGHMALGLTILSMVLIIAVGATIVHWYLSPTYPIKVYILDRTTGRDYQEHRALTWTLNFLRVRKPTDFGPDSAKDNQHTYNFASTFYGFVPVHPTDQQMRAIGGVADVEASGDDRPLPDTIDDRSVVYLADAYSQFVELDYGYGRYVHYMSPKQGILPDDVDRIQQFYDKGNGLLIGEWNTIGYPTLPGVETDLPKLQKGITEGEKGLQFLTTQELPRRQKLLADAKAAGNQTLIATYDQQVRDTQARIAKTQQGLSVVRDLFKKGMDAQAQLDAQRRLEKMLHVHYQGWYGRFVDKFESEHEYDFRMWKNVNDALRKRYKAEHPELSDQQVDQNRAQWEPKGPGFVFYKDGPSEVWNPETNRLEPNPFSEPVVITKQELGEVQTTHMADIYLSGKAKDDPLVQGVAEQLPCRYWFDVVQPALGSQVLSYYKLQIKDIAAKRLRDAGFPADYIKTEGGHTELVFPAAVAYRDGDPKTGTLRSFYFAGDASDYSLVPRFSEMFPATGGVLGFVGSHVGPFSTQFYWNYYQPMLKNILTGREEKRLAYQ